ncbi:MAG: FAD-binding protein, partial [Eudoraea sp.]
MIRNIQVRVPLKEEGQKGILMRKAAKTLGIPEVDFTLKVLRKSIDARKQTIYFNYKLAVYIREKAPENS